MVLQSHVCGATMVLKVTRGHFFQLWMSYVLGTNSRADLLALWGIFIFSWKWNFLSFQVVGDSQVVIDSVARGHVYT